MHTPLRRQPGAMTSVRDRIRAMNASAAASPPAASPKTSPPHGTQQADNSWPQAPVTPELQAPWGVAPPHAAQQPGSAPVHDSAARAARALRPLRSDTAALAAAASAAADLTAGTRSSSVAAAPGAEVVTAAPVVRPSPAASPARPRGYRPPFAGDTSQYRGRVRSMPPRQDASDFSRRSAPAPGAAAAAAADAAAAERDLAALGLPRALNPLHTQSVPPAAAARPLQGLPATVTEGTLPAPPPTYKGRQRSVSAVRSFKAASDPTAVATLAAARAVLQAAPASRLQPAAPTAPDQMSVDPYPQPLAGVPAQTSAEQPALPSQTTASLQSDAVTAAADTAAAATANAPAAVASAASADAMADGAAAADAAHAPDAAPADGAQTQAAADSMSVSAGLLKRPAFVRRSISGSSVGGRSLLGRGHNSVPLSPPPMQVLSCFSRSPNPM